MKSFRDRNPYAVGIGSVLVLGLFTGLAFGVGLLHIFEHTYTVQAVFTDAAGLEKGNDVKLAGVKVGRVTTVKADAVHGHVIVEFVVNNGTKVGRDGATADIALASLLGAKYVRLGGPVEAPYLEDLDKEDRVIPIERTTVPFDVFELTRVATESVEKTDTEALNALINDLADITQDKRASVTALIDGLNRVSTAIAERDAQLRQLLDRADTLSATLADKDQTLVQLVDASQKILDLIASRRDALSAALGEGSEAVQQLSRLIGDHKVELDRILDTLHPTLDLIAANQPTLDASLAWIGPGFYDQAQAGGNGPWLDVFIDSLGPDVLGVLCELFAPDAPTCPPPTP